MDKQKTALHLHIEDIGKQIRATCMPGTKGYQYASIYELVADQGRYFTSQPLPPPFRRMRPKECFHNAATTAIRHHELGIMYCEGYVNVLKNNIVPLLHAWCVDHNGNVIDPTIGYQPHTQYIGIPFELDFVIHAYGVRKAGSILDDWQNGWPLLKDFEAHRR